ncbi:MAG: hypothetical protein RSC99_03745 [Clostridiales bacterium]
MKKAIVFALFFLLTLSFCACGNESASPGYPPYDDSEMYAKYPENVMTYKDTSSMPIFDELSYYDEKETDFAENVIVNPIYKGCILPLTSDELSEFNTILKRSQWEKEETANSNDVNNVKAISFGGSAIVYLFPDDTAAVSSPSDSYKMIDGTYEAALSYLEIVFNRNLEKVLNFEQYFKEVFAADFWIKWRMLYDPPYAKEDDYIYNDKFMCYGSDEIANELLSAFGDTAAWEIVPPEGYLNMFEYDGFAVGINSGDNYCQIFPTDGGTYITFENYAIFYTSENVNKNVMDVLKKHQDQWHYISEEGY